VLTPDKTIDHVQYGWYRFRNANRRLRIIWGAAIEKSCMRRALRVLTQLLVLSFILHLLTGQAAIADTRVALVIGNAAYHHAAPLANPANDARGVVAALQRLGFEVEEGVDLDTTGMHLALRKFAERLQDADVGLFFYAGHALQVRGKNYLAPVDAKLEKESDLIFQGIDLELVLRLLEERPRTSIVFLDACRDNPLARSLALGIGRARSQMIGRGLAGIQSGVGTLIGYATQPDNVALDGKGPNSPFTTALLQNIETPGIEVRQMLSRVRRAVIDATEHQQAPWDHSSLTGDFYFKPLDLETAQTGPASAATEAGSSSSSDAIVWSVIQGSTNPTDFGIFLEKYPQSPFAAFAQSRLTALAARPEIGAPSPTPVASIEAPQAGSGGGQALPTGETGEGQAVAAVGLQAVSESRAQGDDEPESGGPTDAALAALMEEAPPSGPASETTPVVLPSIQNPPSSEPKQAPAPKPEEQDTAALTGQASSADTSSLPGVVEEARAVEQALGLSRDDWREVQRALNTLNHAAGPEDGLPGRRTRAAVEAWQRAIGSGPTGHLTASQHARLLEELAVKLAAVVTITPPQPAEGDPIKPPQPTQGGSIHECDRLAGQPSDLARVGAGVEWQDLDPKPALAACATAMQEYPDEVRFGYQYGRALLRAGSADRARLWFRTAAEAGYALAQRSVGDMYVQGLGVPRNDVQAASWYRRAAEQRDARSQYLLGIMYALGLGVTRDDALAAT
jgi:uncharacterized caspase-like protein/peptidoglycan hydrolase-like protein with peptidoglycan-binding domain